MDAQGGNPRYIGDGDGTLCASRDEAGKGDGESAEGYQERNDARGGVQSFWQNSQQQCARE